MYFGTKRSEVRTGDVYLVKVSDRLAPVSIIRPEKKGWTARALDSGHEVRIRSAQKLRKRFCGCSECGAHLQLLMERYAREHGSPYMSPEQVHAFLKDRESPPAV
jgi:hypothetical protein